VIPVSPSLMLNFTRVSLPSVLDSPSRRSATFREDAERGARRATDATDHPRDIAINDQRTRDVSLVARRLTLHRDVVARFA